MKYNLILGAALAVAMAAPATVDAQRRNERVIINRPLQVESWTPQEGAAGSLVTLTGSGFSRNTLILVGGRRVRAEKMGARAISFRVPANSGDGRIVLRKPGVANDYVVGSFNLWAVPNVTGFGPSSGTFGTRVEIRGRDFSQGDQVMLGAQSLRIDSWHENGLVVTIPQGAVSGYFTVRSPRNAESRSRQQFRVVQPAPLINNFTPVSGAPGTRVRIMGGNFGNDIAVSYGRSSMQITSRGKGWIEVMIPANARRSQAISIRSRRGSVRSSANFALELAPALGSFSPSWATVGTHVTLNGRNFTGSDRVSLSGVNCHIVQVTGNRIIVEVPAGARSGAFAIHRGNQTIKAAANFEVAHAPLISNLNVGSGAPGTQVTLTGQNLVGTRLYLGSMEIRPSTTSATQLQFTIPSRASSGVFRVKNRAGQSNWGKPFEVWNVPQIRRVSPARGGVGSNITISGTMLEGINGVFVGRVSMPIVSRLGGRGLVVRVPPGAKSGAISLSAYGRNSATRHNFDVLRAPVLSSFSPTEGAAGTLITILGDGFDRSTRVRYGNSSLRISRWEPGRLTVEIPRNARRSEYLSVENAGGGAQSRAPFALLVAPSIRDWSPRTAKPMAELTIHGSGLALDTIVQVGSTHAKVLRTGRDGRSIVVAVPNLGSGSYDLSVQHRGMRTVARRRFVVEGWAQVSGISPVRAHIGDTVMLTGAGLNAARVYYGNIELPIVRGDRRGRRLWVRIPEGCRGKSALTIMDGQQQSSSTAFLEILIPRTKPVSKPAHPPNVIINDHRTKRKPKAAPKRKGPGPVIKDHRKKR